MVNKLVSDFTQQGWLLQATEGKLGQLPGLAELSNIEDTHHPNHAPGDVTTSHKMFIESNWPLRPMKQQ